MRLIDADALEYLPLIVSCGNGKYNTVKVLYERDLEDAPTVDIVRHGYWTERNIEDDECRFTRRRWYCSECGKWQCYGKSDYCLNCGAKMDGERKETSDE